MSDERAPGGLPEPPANVEITVIAGARPAREWRRRAAPALAAVAVAGGVIAALFALVSGAGPRSGIQAIRGIPWDLGPPGITEEDAVDKAQRNPGPLGVAAAYGYPLRCLTITIPAGERTYARADFNRSQACGRFDGYVTAIFHRVGGVWARVLEASSYSCPVASLPRSVQAELSVCPD